MFVVAAAAAAFFSHSFACFNFCSVSFLLLYACLIQLRNDLNTFIHSLMTISMISNKQTYALYPNHLNAGRQAGRQSVDVSAVSVFYYDLHHIKLRQTLNEIRSHFIVQRTHHLLTDIYIYIYVRIHTSIHYCFSFVLRCLSVFATKHMIVSTFAAYTHIRHMNNLPKGLQSSQIIFIL